MKKQTSIQISDRCKSEIEQLSLIWGYSKTRYTTAVLERCVHFTWMIFIGYSQGIERWQEMLEVWRAE